MYTKLKTISERVANRLSLDPIEVHKANQVYWRKVRDKMVNPSDIYLNIINIGTIKSSRAALHLEKYKYEQRTKEKELNEFQLEKLNKVLNLIEIYKTLDEHVKGYQATNDNSDRESQSNH